MGWLAKLRDKLHSVDTILSDFDLIVTRLEGAAQHHTVVNQKANDEAVRQQTKAAVASAEIVRSRSVIEKIKALTS